MSYELTIFKSIYDNQTHRYMSLDKWSDFKNMLYELSLKDGYKPKKHERVKGSPLISPALYKAGTTRANSNVTHWGSWAALDVDDYETTFDDALGRFKGISHVYYSSASSTIEKPKFRVVFECSCEIPSDKIKHFWYALNKEYNNLGDPQTKDLSRMYYIPAKYPNSYHFIGDEDGVKIDPYALMERYDYVQPTDFRSSLSDALSDRLFQHKINKLSRDGYNWTHYSDCPFVNKKSIAEYKSITSHGWYSKMYNILCSTAANAIKSGYNINEHELVTLVRQLDADTGSWYTNRPLDVEARRALTWALQQN